MSDKTAENLKAKTVARQQRWAVLKTNCRKYFPLVSPIQHFIRESKRIFAGIASFLCVYGFWLGFCDALLHGIVSIACCHNACIILFFFFSKR